MKNLGARYSKLLLILIGVLVALVIGFQSNAVGSSSTFELNSTILYQVEKTIPVLKYAEQLNFMLLSLLE